MSLCGGGFELVEKGRKAKDAWQIVVSQITHYANSALQCGQISV